MYNFGIHILALVLRILAVFNKKIKLGVDGRKQSFKLLEDHFEGSKPSIWFHCASLGEYEQGLPVFQALKKKFSSHTVVLTFFSPSGYEIRKHSKIADLVVYLPLDTKANAKRFLDLVKPELTVFVKYDVWPNYLKEVQKRNHRAILISALFRKNQTYFKFYGAVLHQALKAFEYVFVQNEGSKKLAAELELQNIIVSGDTRYDRVSNQLEQDNSLDFIANFKVDSCCVVIGSSWPEDEQILLPYINEKASEKLKFIIAPHNINPIQIAGITKKLKVPYTLFSEKEKETNSHAQVFVVDTIGLLSKIYSYADIAYVGGAMGTTGLHNILEPAVFGVPIIIGKNHSKFPEAARMISEAGVTSIEDSKTLTKILDLWVTNEKTRQSLGTRNAKFIEKNSGAVVRIMESIRI